MNTKFFYDFHKDLFFVLKCGWKIEYDYVSKDPISGVENSNKITLKVENDKEALIKISQLTEKPDAYKNLKVSQFTERIGG